MEKIDITLQVTPAMAKDAQGNERMAFTGHLGTHFDVMDKEFPLDYTELDAVVFDISDKGNAETTLSDVDDTLIQEGMFVAFHSHYIETVGCGVKYQMRMPEPMISVAIMPYVILMDGNWVNRNG